MTLQVPTVNITSASDSPWKNPAAWDTVKVAGVYYGWGAPQGTDAATVGGLVRIRGAKRTYRLDAKEPKGQDGFVTTYRGVKSETFEIRFHIWTPHQYDYFTGSVLPALFYSGVKNAQNPSGVQALEVYHPILANLAIGSVEVAHISGIGPSTMSTNEAPQMYECVVQVREYLPPPPQNTTVTPKGNKSVNQPTTPGLVARPAVAANAATIKNLQNKKANLTQ